MKVAFFSFGACEGCRYRIVNELRKITELSNVEVVREPLLGLVSDAEFDVAVVEGAVTQPDIEKLKLIREKAKHVVALGSCAVLGGITTLGYRLGLKLEEYEAKGYTEALPLHRVIKVDSYVRGCPASVDELAAVLRLLSTNLRAEKYERRFEYERVVSGSTITDEFLSLDPGKCIVCGRCVELCAYIGAHALTQAQRGFRVFITTPAQLPFLEVGCVRCGLCAAYCPVAAITYRSDVEAALKLAREGGSALIETYALESAAAVLGVKPGQVVSLLRELGFGSVSVVNPLREVLGFRGLVPFSSAEERWLRKNFPHLAVDGHVKLKCDTATLVITACAARKEDHKPTLTAHELVELLKGSRIVLSDLPEAPLNAEEVKGVRVVVGPDACKAVVKEQHDYGSQPTVLQLCPGGCARGSGTPYRFLILY